MTLLQKRRNPMGRLRVCPCVLGIILWFPVFGSDDGKPSTYDTNSVAIQVNQELAKAKVDGSSNLVRLLLSPPPKSLQSPLQGEKSDALRGKSLPSFYFDPRFPGRDFDAVNEGKLYGGNATQFQFSWRLLYLIPELIKNDSEDLVTWVAARSNQLPPTPVDIITSIALSSSPVDKLDPSLWVKTRPKWREMLKAKNAIYRLHALRLVRYFETNPVEAVNHYELALREQNTIFQFVAIQGLKESGGEKAREAIKQFIQRKPSPDDGTLSFDLNIVTVAEAALNKME